MRIDRTIVIILRPEAKWSNYGQVEDFYKSKDWTHKCCKILGWSVIRGERLIKLSYSWFSTKPI
jgi:hypothetical protein